ncbi:hypothetical protein A6452_38885 [Bradyrhizobium elkanii]|nr:hypothetical protein A6452_38885 [Bradyrhizobium elkanii]
MWTGWTDQGLESVTDQETESAANQAMEFLTVQLFSLLLERHRRDRLSYPPAAFVSLQNKSIAE